MGNQSNTGTDGIHLHVQALDGRWPEDKLIPSGEDTNLESRIPYWYINYWI